MRPEHLLLVEGLAVGRVRQQHADQIVLRRAPPLLEDDGQVVGQLRLGGVERVAHARRVAMRAHEHRDVARPHALAAQRLAHLVADLHLGAGVQQGLGALDVVDDPLLPRADRLVLFTPMIGITRFARFAGLAGLPAVLPAFANAAWLSVVPEFNPFKYNSFPVNGARQSYRLTDALQSQIQRLARAGQLGSLPPVLTFQSVIDFTVSTRAIISSLYAYLPANGSELVLFDLNRSTKFGPLLRTGSDTVVARLLPEPPPSPPRSVWATVVAAWLICWRRCRLLAHAGCWVSAGAASAPP